jgi:lipopolysaccharide biosynthesis glycosyltransferase
MKVIVQGHPDSKINGTYIKKSMDNIDKDTTSFFKDDEHQIYRFNGLWRIGICCKGTYIILNECKNKDWNIKLLNLSNRNLNMYYNFNKNNYINICFCSDERLINFIPTVINSIQDKNINNNIKIHYIHNIKNDDKLEKLKNYISKFKNLSFKFYYKTWDYNYKGIKHITNATMLRLFIPKLIQEKKVLYLDIDIIVNINLKNIYNINCNSTGIALKNSIVYSELKNKKSGNCGVMLIDLNQLRKNKFTEKCLKIHKNNNNRHDQYIINVYCQGNHTILKPNYTVFLDQDMHVMKKNKDFILHYAGSSKPYYEDTGSAQYLWDKYKCDLTD